ncbi:MAG: MerR family transcriptional regulator, partial [Niameybacter sp.]
KTIQDAKVKVSMERGIIYDFNPKGDVVPQYVFNVIERDKNIGVKEAIKILPKGNYLTVAYSKVNEEVCKMKIDKYLRDNHLKSKSIIEVDLLDDIFDTKAYSCQIQMHIEEGE